MIGEATMNRVSNQLAGRAELLTTAKAIHDAVLASLPEVVRAVRDSVAAEFEQRMQATVGACAAKVEKLRQSCDAELQSVRDQIAVLQQNHQLGIEQIRQLLAALPVPEVTVTNHLPPMEKWIEFDAWNRPFHVIEKPIEKPA